MQHATDKTVLGNFNDASFDYYGVHSRFFRKDGKFLVETDGPDGKLAVFEVKYTFGVDPLQQYLVEFPDGRLQALSLAWDSRPQDKGGQRWFHLYPNEEIKHDDILHWTKLNQNWNFMCAECHSTGLRKNYDAKADRFATTWAEISVGCEACHGQGSPHAAWARDQKSWWPFGKREDPSKGLLVRFDERHGVAWPIDPQTGTARRSAAPATLRKEVETCGLCHARRAGFHEDWVPGQSLSQTHVVEPLARNTYHADGQIRDVEEPYNYTPFKQSKMFAAGVTCSDCHEPHSCETSGFRRGCLPAMPCFRQICRCEASPPRRRRSAANMHLVPHAGPHLYGRRSTARSHLSRPAARSFRQARDAERLQRLPQRQARAMGRRRRRAMVRPKPQGFSDLWRRHSMPRARTRPMPPRSCRRRRGRNAPAVARASALSELAPRVSPANIGAARAGLTDPDPMVRIGALDMLENVPAGQVWPWFPRCLSDPVRGVRIRAVSLLAAVPTASQPQSDRERFDQAASEFIAAQRANAERPEARTTLANFFAQRGQTAEAETEYKAALQLSPQYVDGGDQSGRPLSAARPGQRRRNHPSRAIAASPREAAAHHALGCP